MGSKGHSYKLLLALGAAFAVITISAIIVGQTSTAQAATYPGYNGKLVVSAWPEPEAVVHVYEVDFSTSSISQLNADSLTYPSFSPDGSKLVFLAWIGGDYEIVTMDADGTNVQQLTNNASADYISQHPWSPDGSKIGFISNSSGSYAVYTMDPDGTNVQLVSTTAPLGSVLQWSPDGSKIGFLTGPFGGSSLVIANSDGSGEYQAGLAMDFDWSPDGSKIAYQERVSFRDQIGVMDADGSNRTLLTSGAFSNKDPRWSLDGSVIGFSSSRRGDDMQLHTMNPDGSNVQVLIPDVENHPNYANAYAVYSWTWSPDGKHVTSLMYEETFGRRILHDYNIETGEYIQLSQPLDNTDTWPTWQPIINTAPATADNSLTTPYNTPATIDVLTNDTDEEALDGQYLSIDTQALNGTAEVVNGEIQYSPNTGFKGNDQLTYQICDSFLPDQKCSTGVLSITVQNPGAPALSIVKIDNTSFNGTGNKYTVNTTKPIFSGTATAGATINILLNPGSILLTTTATESGVWSISPSSDLPLAEYTVAVSATLNGETTTLTSFVLGITVVANTSTNTEVPNTGFNSWPWRISGIMLVAIGAYLYQRKSTVKLMISNIKPDW